MADKWNISLSCSLSFHIRSGVDSEEENVLLNDVCPSFGCNLTTFKMPSSLGCRMTRNMIEVEELLFSWVVRFLVV
jgi:hypothetical protein